MGRHAIVRPELPQVGRILPPHEVEVARKKVGLSVDDLAVLVDLTPDVVAQIEDGGPFRVRDALMVKQALVGWCSRGHRRGRGSL